MSIAGAGQLMASAFRGTEMSEQGEQSIGLWSVSAFSLDEQDLGPTANEMSTPERSRRA